MRITLHDLPVSLPTDRPMRLPDLARFAMDLSQRVVDRSAAALAPGTTISCRKGCAACCRQVVPVSAPEAWMLAETVAGLPAHRRDPVLARFAEAGDSLESGGLTREPALALADLYFALQVPCPFLEDEACSIHPWRPAACREHMVTSPAARCAVWQGGWEHVPLPQAMGECLAFAAARLLGGPPEFIPLVAALDWAGQHAADGHKTWEGPVIMAAFADALDGRA